MRQEEFNEKVWKEYEELKRGAKIIIKFIVMFIILSSISSTITLLSLIGAQIIHNYIY